MKWFVSVFVLATSASLAAAQPADKLHAALRQTVTLEFDNLTLDQIAERLQRLTSTSVILHESLRPLIAARDEHLTSGAAASGAALVPADPNQVQQPRGFSCSLRQLPLANAMQTFLEHYGLGYALVNESIVIATADKARQMGRERPAALQFDNVPLTKALEELRSRHGIEVILDRHALNDPKTPVTLHAQQTSLEEAVHLLADCVDLHAAPLSSGWILTTADKASAWRARAQQRAEAAKAQTITYPPADAGGGLVGLGGPGGAGFLGGGPAGFTESVAIPRAFLQSAGPPPRVGQGEKKEPMPAPKPAPAKKSLAAETLKKMNEPSGIMVQNPITLKEAIQTMEDNGFPPIVIYVQAFKDENPEMGDLHETQIRWPQVKGLPRSKVLQLILDQVPTGNANFLVRPGYVLVTTNDTMHANKQLVRGVSFVQLPLDEALQELSELSGISVALDPKVGDKAKTLITARFPGQTNVAQIARVLADMADLKAVRVDNIMYVTSRANATEFPREIVSGGKFTMPDVAP